MAARFAESLSRIFYWMNRCRAPLRLIVKNLRGTFASRACDVVPENGDWVVQGRVLAAA